MPTQNPTSRSLPSISLLFPKVSGERRAGCSHGNNGNILQPMTWQQRQETPLPGMTEASGLGMDNSHAGIYLAFSTHREIKATGSRPAGIKEDSFLGLSYLVLGSLGQASSLQTSPPDCPLPQLAKAFNKSPSAQGSWLVPLTSRWPAPKQAPHSRT